jgi:hypothetical protein
MSDDPAMHLTSRANCLAELKGLYSWPRFTSAFRNGCLSTPKLSCEVIRWRMQRMKACQKPQNSFSAEFRESGELAGCDECLPKSYRRILLRLSLVNWALRGPSDSRRALADYFRDLEPRESLSSELKDPISIEHRSRPANGPSAARSILLRPRQPCTHSF